MLEKLESAEKSLAEHELLEILLYNAIPRKDTNEIAHRLLSTFGNLRGVFCASKEELAEVEGVGGSTAAYLRVIALFYEKLTFKEEEPPSAYSVGAFAGYLTERLRGLKEEVVELFAVDPAGRVRHTTRFTSGLSDKAAVSMRDVSAFLAKTSHALVIAHNHPVGGATPSPADDNFTKQVQTLCSINNVRLYDHFIISGEGYFSYYGSGRLDIIRDRYNPGTLFGGDID